MRDTFAKQLKKEVSKERITLYTRKEKEGNTFIQKEKGEGKMHIRK